MLKLWYFFVRLLYYPFLNWILPWFSQSFKERIQFEKLNTEPVNESFSKSRLKADFAFEVSSEGELEQVKPVVEKLLKDKVNIELIYCSNSVEKQCLKLAQLYGENIRLLRLPLVTFLPFGKKYVGNWLTAKTFFFCRYDFFPELIMYGKRADVKMILLSGTMKNFKKKTSNPLARWYYNYVYKSFDKVVMSTNLDKELLQKEFDIAEDHVETYDFRPIQIYKRIRNKREHLNKHFPAFETFNDFLTKYDKSKRVILGSYWNDEKIITSDISKLINEGYHLAIVPHKLDEENIEQIKETINKTAPALEIYEINANMGLKRVQNTLKQMMDKNGVLIINLKGILCELYTLYGHAYVAGGYRLSVHSLMEPYLGESMIYCGPKIHRSTEYDLIRQSNPDRIMIIEKENAFIHEVLKTDIGQLSSMSSFKSHYEGHYAPLLIWLGVQADWGVVDA